MKINHLYIMESSRFNDVTHKIEYFYKATINLKSGKEHTVELNLTEDENKEIIKVVAPILEKAFSDIKEEVKRELEDK